MTDAAVAAEAEAGVVCHVPPAGRASEVLAGIAADHAPRLTLDELLNSLGDRTFGIVLLILALFNCVPLPPGASVVFGATMMLVAAQLLIGRHRLWLPGLLRRRSVQRQGFAKVVVRVAPVLRRVEGLCQPRASWLTNGAFERLIGLIVLIMAFVITLPIPVIGNIPPGIAVAVLSIGLIERDGWAAIAGMLLACVAFAINATLVTGVALAGLRAVEHVFSGS